MSTPEQNRQSHRATWITVVAGLVLAAACIAVAVALGGEMIGVAAAAGVFLVGAPAIAMLTRKTVDHDALDAAAHSRARWEQARTHHDEVLGEYSAWELDPAHLLSTPGLWDYSRPEVQEFFDTMTRAGQLKTASYPDGRADEYADTVDKLRRTWHEATRYATTVGTSFLDDDSRSLADQALKLWTHAQSAREPGERATYAQRALDDVNELVRRRVLPRSLGAVRELERGALGQIES